MIYVLDACSLLSYLNDEPGSEIVDCGSLVRIGATQGERILKTPFK